MIGVKNCCLVTCGLTWIIIERCQETREQSKYHTAGCLLWELLIIVPLWPRHSHCSLQVGDLISAQVVGQFLAVNFQHEVNLANSGAISTRSTGQ
jgi:hypothetical protein